MKGEIITSIDRVIELAKERKAVVFRGTPPKAAAFFIGWPVRSLHDAIVKGCLYEYNKPTKN